MDEHPIILFDGVCNLCNQAVQYVIRHDPTSKFRFATLQGATGISLLNRYKLSTNDLNSFVLIDKGQAFTRSTAALNVARKLSGITKLLYGFIIVPRLIRDFVYKVIANNRYRWFGKKESCMIPTPDLSSRFLN